CLRFFGGFVDVAACPSAANTNCEPAKRAVSAHPATLNVVLIGASSALRIRRSKTTATKYNRRSSEFNAPILGIEVLIFEEIESRSAILGRSDEPEPEMARADGVPVFALDHQGSMQPQQPAGIDSRDETFVRRPVVVRWIREDHVK